MGAQVKSDPLAVKMSRNDAKAKCVRDYMLLLLERLFVEEEGFSGKRPFGNSGWTFELKAAFIKSGHIEGSLDSDGYVETCNDKQFDSVISQCLTRLRYDKFVEAF